MARQAHIGAALLKLGKDDGHTAMNRLALASDCLGRQVQLLISPGGFHEIQMTTVQQDGGFRAARRLDFQGRLAPELRSKELGNHSSRKYPRSDPVCLILCRSVGRLQIDAVAINSSSMAIDTLPDTAYGSSTGAFRVFQQNRRVHAAQIGLSIVHPAETTLGDFFVHQQHHVLVARVSGNARIKLADSFTTAPPAPA